MKVEVKVEKDKVTKPPGEDKEQGPGIKRPPPQPPLDTKTVGDPKRRRT